VGLCLEGNGTYQVGGKRMPFQAGAVVAVTDAEAHYSQSAPGLTSRWLYLFLDPGRLVGDGGAARDVLAPAPLAGPGFTNVVAPGTSPALADVVRLLTREVAQTRDAPARAEAIRGLTWTMMALLRRHAAAARAPGPRRLRPALELIARRFAESLDLATLAAACELPERTFRRQFAAALGSSPLRYLNAFRVEQACARFDAGETAVLEVALEVGFESPSAFYKHFRAIKGCTPRAYRDGRSAAP
jgi:AraC-like DNA-binding protein